MNQQTFVKRSASSVLAEELTAAAITKAHELGKAFSIAVVDESGVLKAFQRMDGATLVSVQVSQDKAFSAVQSNRATHEWKALFDENPDLAMGAPAGIHRLIAFGGGYPLKVDGELIGGIGVSGGHPTEDMAVASAAMAAVGLDDS